MNACIRGGLNERERDKMNACIRVGMNKRVNVHKRDGISKSECVYKRRIK